MLKPKVEAEEEEMQIEEDVDNRIVSQQEEEEDEEEEAGTTTVQTLTKEMFNAITATNMAITAMSAEVTRMR